VDGAPRQNPRSDRETAPNVLQPGVLANSTLFGVAHARHRIAVRLAQLALDAKVAGKRFVDEVFPAFFSVAYPRQVSVTCFAKPLSEGFAERRVPSAEVQGA